MDTALQLMLVLLAAAVVVVVVFRLLKLPAILGYLLVGVIIGPSALDLIGEADYARHLAEFGVVFLMFSIGLEFSLPRLKTMRGIVFGLGPLQVLFTLITVATFAALAGVDWRGGIALGGALAMSSTAIVGKMLEERLELNTLHGRHVIGILLFQDLAVVFLLILVPALAEHPDRLVASFAAALLKAAIVLTVLLVVGQRLMRRWFQLIARQKSAELFMLNVLLITLGLAYVTDQSGLSYALGAFVAGMLIAETEFRYQVEADIRPFRDVLLGLFFVTVGMRLNLALVVDSILWIGIVLLLIVAVKGGITAAFSRLLGCDNATALRTGLDLAQAGEFGFVLLAVAAPFNLIEESILQAALAAMVISMLAAPFIIERSERIVRHFSGAEWLVRAMQLHNVAVQAMAVSGHVLVCGYGRCGQSLARLLHAERISIIALDADPKRVREAAAAGDHVVFGDASRREVLIAAGLARARALVVTVADTELSFRILERVRAARPDLPVIVRTLDDADIDRLKEAGAAAVVPEILEGSIMLGAHALMLVGVPLHRVLKRTRDIREGRYTLLRGFFHGATDEVQDAARRGQKLLHSVLISPGAAAIGKTLAELGLSDSRVEARALRRGGIQMLEPSGEERIAEGDVVVLFGSEVDCAAAEIKLMQG